MVYSINDIISIIVGTMASIVVLYRIIVLMIPMIVRGISTNNVPLIFQALSLVV